MCIIKKTNSVVINRWSFGSFHDRRLQHRLSSLMFTGNWCVRGRLLKKTWSSVHKWIRLCTVGYIFSVRICWPEHYYILSDSSGSGSAAPSSLLLGRLLHLPLPPLHDLHPLGFVARSLLSPELVHVLEEPVPARRREHQRSKIKDFTYVKQSRQDVSTRQFKQAPKNSNIYRSTINKLIAKINNENNHQFQP